MRAINGTVFGHDYFTPSLTEQHELGAVLRLVDGRVFHYAKAGVVDLVAGHLLQSSVPAPLHLGMATVITAPATTVPVGTLQLTLTPGAAAAEANLYAEGYLDVDTAPGNGVGLYRVSGHPAIVASTAFMLTLDDPIAVALTSASRVGLMVNPYKGVVSNPIVKTGEVVGVAPFVIPAASYGWVQTWGMASVLINGTPAQGAAVGVGATTAGSLDTWTVGPVLGEMAQLGVSGKNNFVYLRIAS